MLHDIAAFIVMHDRWTGLFVCVIAFVEGVALLGTFIPGSAILVVVGASIGGDPHTFWPLMVLGMIGAIAGDTLSYRLGTIHGSRILARPVFAKQAVWIERTRLLLQWRGDVGVVLGRLCPPTRAVMPMLAGMCSLTLTRFLIADIFAAAIWSIAHLGGGTLLVAAIDLDW